MIIGDIFSPIRWMYKALISGRPKSDRAVTFIGDDDT